VKVMVACQTLTWIEVDTETGEVGPARVFNLPENVEVEEHSDAVQAVDADEDHMVSDLDWTRAIALVRQAIGYEWRLEEMKP
jgi:hypothetical protein